jgi:peptidyl-prolyl cis-trans isomerase SurA
MSVRVSLSRWFADSWLQRPIAVLVLLGIGLCAPALVHAQTNSDGEQKQLVDRIVAVVGDDIVLKSDVDQFVRRMMQQQQNATYSKGMWMNALNQLVDQKILAEQARRDTTITVTDQQVEQRLEQRVQQLVQSAGGEAQLEKVYGKSVLEIKEDFRGDFREQLLAQQLQQRKMRNLEITPSEVQGWFERIPKDSLPDLPKTVRLQHIVRYPKPDAAAKEEAKQVITSIRDSIVNGGASFEAMARQFSDDSGTASSGGRLTDVSLNDLVPEFAAIASRTPVGQISQVFYNDQHDGYHVLRVNARDGNTIDLNHILIRVDQSRADGSEAKQYLRSVRDTLMQYEDVPFELMARRHSEEKSTANNGGRVVDPQSGVRDLVFNALGPSWQKTIRNLDEGEVSQPTEVQLLNGDRAYHIVKLQRRVPAHRVNLEHDYERIRGYALQDKRSRKMQEWIQDLREEIYVDIRVNKDELPDRSEVALRR